MVSNFQYLVTCVAFSVSKPFRLPIWTNKPFLSCVIFLIIFNSLCVLLPDNNPVVKLFNLLPFQTSDGTSYYDYRAWISVGILLNALLTLGVEKIITGVITVKADERKVFEKNRRFHAKMLSYLSGSSGIVFEEY